MTQLVGILNITPDSFSDGGLFIEPEKALIQALKLFEEGADYLDIGAQSTRPGAKMIPWEKEWIRLEPILKSLLKKYPGKISLDTFRPEIAQKFIDLGGTIINDVMGFQNEAMIQVALKMFEKIHPKERTFKNRENLPFVIVNHFPGESVSEVHTKEINGETIVIEDLLARKVKLIRAGIPSECIVLDPGIGFGKTMELNESLLNFGDTLPDERILIGHSRKRFLGENRMNPEVNLEAGKRAINSGAEFLRVHEVKGYKVQSQVAVFGGSGSQTDFAISSFAILKECPKVYYNSMEAVCDAVESGEAQYGILPIFNTVGGDVPEAIKALDHFEVQEINRQKVAISFHLAAKEKIILKQVKEVLSHWQSLAQSHEWLRENIAHVKKKEVLSSSEAARIVASSKNKFITCICHHQTAVDEGLVFLANHIEIPGNQTTFVCLKRRNR